MLAFFKNNRIGNAFFQMSGAGTIVQIVAFFLTPVLSRLYTPTDYGIFGTLCSISAFFSIVAAFRYEYAFFIKKKNIEYFFSICLGLIIITSFATSIILPHYFDYSFTILFIVLLSTSLFNITTQFSVALSQYKTLSFARIGQGVTQYLLALCLGLMLLPSGLIYSFIAGQIVASLYLFYKSKISFKNISMANTVKIVKENSIYCVNSTITSALQWSTPLAPMLIGNFIYSTNVLGVYFLISQAVSAVTSIPRRSLINICTSELNSPENFRERLIPFMKKILHNKITFFIIAVAIGVTVVFYFFGEPIISFFLGNKWGQGGQYVGILISYGMIEVLLYPFIHLLNLWGKYRSAILIESSRFICVFLILPIFAYYSGMEFPMYIFLHLLCMLIFNVITFLCLMKSCRIK